MGSLVVWDHYLAWAAADSQRANTNRVVVHDLDAGTSKLIARSASSDGETDWVRGSGTTVVFTDLARVPSDATPKVPWKILVADVTSGSVRTVAASASAHDEDVAPLPEIESPWIVWVQAAANPRTNGPLDIVAFNLATGSRHTVIGQVNPSWVTIDEGKVVYDNESGAGGRDVFTISVNGGQPVRLTTSGKVAHPVAANGAVTWQEPTFGDATSLWMVPLDGRSPPLQFAANGTSNAFPGAGFVLWLGAATDESLFAAKPGAGSERVVVEARPSIPARWRADGRRIVWATMPPPGQDRSPSTIHVATIEP